MLLFFIVVGVVNVDCKCDFIYFIIVKEDLEVFFIMGGLVKFIVFIE